MAPQGFDQQRIHQPRLHQVTSWSRVGGFFAQQAHQAGQAVDAAHVHLAGQEGNQQGGVGGGEFEPTP